MNPNFWQNKNVLITGVSGFVGSWLAKALVERNAHVVGLTRDFPAQSALKSFDLMDKITLVFGSVTDFLLLERLLNEYEIHFCFHLAAQALVGVANRNPLSTFETNVRGTWCVLEACRKARQLLGVIVASSDKAYGTNPQLPYQEHYPLLATDPYGASKACADILARSYHQGFELPLGVTRCANIYGGGDFNRSRLIPGTFFSIFNGEQPVIRSDGTKLRDYLYIEDAVSGYLLLASQLQNRSVQGEAFNFGSGCPISVLEVVEKILSVSGVTNLKPKVEGKAETELPAQWVCTKKAHELLGWEAKVSFEKGLMETAKWYRRFWESLREKKGTFSSSKG